MSDHVDFKFTYKGHSIQVSLKEKYEEWSGAMDMIFTVLIDGATTVVPGIWNAYKRDGEKGIKLVVKAYLDVSPL